MFREAASKWAETDPVGAANSLTENSSAESVGGSASSKVVERWVLRAPDKAIDWAETLPEQSQKYAFLSAARTWPQGRFDEFASRLSSEASAPTFDWARAELARRYVDIKPAFALSLSGTIVDAETRERSLANIVERVIESDPAALEAWLPGSGFSAESLEKILSPDR